MRILSLLLALGIVFSACKEQPAQNRSPKTEPLQSALDSVYQAHPDARGIMVTVLAPDQNLSWTSAAGYADTSGTPLEADQPVLIASNTKTYVAIAMLRLIEEGKFTLGTAISSLLSEKTDSVLRADGYQTDSIAVMHLLSHTSGIADYTGAPYMDSIIKSPMRRWTRDEQIALSMRNEDLLDKAGRTFSYADINFLLSTEIMEQTTGEDDFVKVMHELLQLKEKGMEHTWFMSLEPKRSDKALALQTITSDGMDSYGLDPSIDLYGGGGIACTSEDLARFIQGIFDKIYFSNPETFDLLFTKIRTRDSVQSNYYLGMDKSKIAGMTAYGHGGFWGTVAKHIPEINTTVAIFVLERDKRGINPELLEVFTREVQKLALEK